MNARVLVIRNELAPERSATSRVTTTRQNTSLAVSRARTSTGTQPFGRFVEARYPLIQVLKLSNTLADITVCVCGHGFDKHDYLGCDFCGCTLSGELMRWYAAQASEYAKEEHHA